MRTVHPGRSVILVSAVLLASCASVSPTTGPTASIASPSPTGSALLSIPPPPTVTPSPTATPSPAPSDAPTPTPFAAAPPKPKGTTFKLVKQTFLRDPIGVTSTYRATWTEPAASATSFTVYGVADCLRYAKANDGEPCVVPGMRIPPAQLKVLATVGGDKRSVLVKWTTYGELSIDPYQAVLLSASNQYGESRSAILHSERVCYNCVY